MKFCPHEPVKFGYTMDITMIPQYKSSVLLSDDGTVYKYWCEIAISILCILLVISVGVNIFFKCRMSSKTITQKQTGQENYDNLSDSKEGHIYTAMATPK